MKIKNIFVSLGSRMLASPDSILLLKAELNYTKIYLNNGDVWLSSTNLGQIAKRLEPYNFLRPNRSVLLNAMYLKEYNEVGGYLKMKNQEVFKISRRKIKEFQFLSNCTSKVD
ncbi:LytR/AlgR family response regulator transcription factor [Lacihabitans sp. CS3-21]|uniref:LytR/AlgR family response regulator transcription factor n=1 Tax=Lacihabitans sp. CS3-21 TaxID=2487332 RepID=UPI002887A632|nr:LytTR family transcriptional regulator [Lacihabitans sp. CS3-21]